MIDVLALLAAVAIAYTVSTGIEWLLSLWGHRREIPESVVQEVEMSDTDEKMIEETQQLIRECFGEDAVEALRKASNKERITMMAEFAEKLAEMYGLDIEVDVTVSSVQNCGSYNWKEKKAQFNIALLTIDGSNEHFEYCVREVLDTIIHELRHAVQHRAINEEGFWEVSEERRNEWANNMASGNYIRPEVDMRGYQNQPIEADASTFAGRVMKGVK